VVDYAAILLTLCGLFGWRLAQRLPLGLDVLHDRNQLYRETAGLIENVYLLKIINKDDVAHRYELAVDGIDGLRIASDVSAIVAAGGDVLSLPLALRADEAALVARSLPVLFTLTAVEDPTLSVVAEAKFLGPLR
jgi:polyferredoxin